MKTVSTLIGFLAAILLAIPAAAQDNCSYDQKICDARQSVFAIASDYYPLGSAVRIGETRLVTNRHLVVDQETVKVLLPDGTRIDGTVVPTAYTGDLVFIEAELGDGPTIALDDDNDQGPYHTVGAEIATETVRVYPEGRKLALGDTPGARLHHQAYAQPGNSGGALVDREGELVAVIASGGQGLNEAIPVSELARLEAASGPEQKTRSFRIGLAYRGCDMMVEEVQSSRTRVRLPLLIELEDACIETGNRQMIDFAAIEAGKQGAYEMSAELFELSLGMDPASVKTKLSYLTTLHLMARFEDEVPIIKELLEVIPEEQSLHRFAIQAGKWGGDPELARLGLELVEEYNPQMAEAARRFLEADMPPPRARRPQQN